MTSNLASVQKEHNKNQMHWVYRVDHYLSEESIVAYKSLLIILNPI
jgi:glucose-6-phosphate 1-dehydrogenase